MNSVLQEIQQRAAVLPLALQSKLLNYTMYLTQKAQEAREWNKLMLAPDLASKQPTELLVDRAKDLPAIAAFANKDPLRLQQEMRDAGLNTNGQAMAGSL
ncbi:MAG: hypothetical protein PHX60_11580 [Giesbergeria sp.]|uniref:hypothetical protein n=1 Tax=Giesbergeria sp. TaxID=2818473 RepID=UPI002608B801|nr:hypothetical protein [Giesbergeria sp.]MDD2610303.1 hypothetical protein [Giesbergeria sp.]